MQTMPELPIDLTLELRQRGGALCEDRDYEQV